MRKIRVLVVDDSILFREVLARGISSDAYIEVIATANDPFDARDKILMYEPDVMTCDVEMPRMNGIEFIRRLLPQYPLPIIVVSTVSKAVFDAMNAGAVDFATKPDVSSVKSIENFINELIVKIKVASTAKIAKWKPSDAPGKITAGKSSQAACGIIAIGASTGGTEAIYSILKALPETTPGIVIVQHIPPVFSAMFAERLNNSTSLKVREAQTGDCAGEGYVLIAPGDRHMRVKKTGGKYMVECFVGEKVNGHCPSVDVLFDSAAKAAGSDAIGVILTGMGSDGTRGLMAMKQAGARTLGQDEQSSIVYGMPKAAYDAGAVEKQVALGDLPAVIYSLSQAGGKNG